MTSNLKCDVLSERKEEIDFVAVASLTTCESSKGDRTNIMLWMHDYA